MSLALLACVAFASPALSPADAKVFPSKVGPALSGELASLRWGMTADEVKAAAPIFAKAIYLNVSDDKGQVTASGREDWVPFAGGQLQLWVQGNGLESIRLRYPSRAAALKAFKVWKAPANPRNAQKFEFWTGAKGGMRGLLRPDEKGYQVELSPFVPLAKTLGEGAVFAPGGKALLGSARADVCLQAIDHDPDPERFIVPPSERSSGSYLVKVDWEDGKIASYKLYVDYTYDDAVRAQIPKLLEKKLGKARDWRPESQGAYGPACLAFGGSGAKADVIACDGKLVGMRPISVWTIYVGEAPALL
ncbi:MAG TPA: hypothetical protein VM261_26790 [Kofleriaceae bacterium]|nr:hypothetical protein [Kofleriaceae bacterium]